MQKIIIFILSSLIVVGVVALSLKYNIVRLPLKSNGASNQGGGYKAVFLSNNQVFFGTLKNESSQSIELENVYYLRQVRDTSNATQNKLDLIKRGTEVHGPKDVMTISRNHILYIENVGPDAQLAQAITRAKDSNSPQTVLGEVSSLTASLLPSSSSSPSASSKKNSLTIKESEAGFLRVRSEPTTNSQEVGRVNPGATFTIGEEKDGWYQIEYQPRQKGWVSGSYVTVIGG